MKLIDSSEVCEMLGISKSTLYRWCGIKEGNEEGNKSLALGVSRGMSFAAAASRMMPNGEEDIANLESIIDKLTDNEPRGFPRPFKIGRAFKWNVAEIEQ